MAAGLRRIQNQLERLYEINIEHNVDQFLITDAALVRQLDSSSQAREVPEKLLVHQEGEDVNISLYLDQTLVETMEEDDPTESLHDGNLNAFWTVLEGISHFLYLAWNAGYGRSVSLLELELQAEVDKFIVAALLLGRQRGGRIPASLHPRLFANPSFDDKLDHASLVRYHTANTYASRYCAHLQKRFLRDRRGSCMIKELRQFYRLMHRRKLDRIRTMN